MVIGTHVVGYRSIYFTKQVKFQKESGCRSKGSLDIGGAGKISKYTLDQRSIAFVIAVTILGFRIIGYVFLENRWDLGTNDAF